MYWGVSMIISKVINNNVVSAYDDEQHELVIMGRGIAFQKKKWRPT
ncbi:CAT RNA binding domain-containing protein [Bacillus sp. SL00103]